MSKILLVFLLFFFSFPNAREIGQTEITAEEGIEIFQKEKYYLLKKNVEVESDNLSLKAQNVRAYFDKDLYDIIKIFSIGNVSIKSDNGLDVKGQEVDYIVKNEDIYIRGKNSFLKNVNFTMISDESIKLKNSTGEFEINGKNSKLLSEDVEIIGSYIQGNYSEINGANEVDFLQATDENEVYIKTQKLKMYALKAEFNNKTNIIELYDSVKIIRDEELITGDYAQINTLDDSYKIKSNESKKVKVLLTDKE